MTEAIPIDVSGKVISNTKPSAAPVAGAAKPPDKPPEPPPAPGSKTFLGWVAGSITRKQLMVAVAAVCSLGAGIAAMKLLWPNEEPPASNAATALLSETQTAPSPTEPPRSAPSVTIEPPSSAELIPPAGLPPVSPARSTTGTIPPPGGLEKLPDIPLPGSSPPPPSSAALVPPAAPTSVELPRAPGVPPATGAAIPEPGPLVPAVLPAGGTDPKPAPPAGTGMLPAIPSTPGPSSLPAPPAASGPLVPALPGTPAATPGNSNPNSEPKPPAPIMGMPPSSPAAIAPAIPPASLVPPVDVSPKIPAPSQDLNPTTPPGPGASGARAGGEKIEFVKPAESLTAAPATRPPTTSYDVDIYHPKANDSWESISREYYSDTRYAAALRTYNQNRALAPGREVDVPPIHVLRRLAPAPVAGTPPTRPTPPGGDPWSAADIGTVSGKIYRVPPGDGMTLPAVAKLVLGNDQRWRELYDLNPDVNPSRVPAGTELKLPADARVQ